MVIESKLDNDQLQIYLSKYLERLATREILGDKSLMIKPCTADASNLGVVDRSLVLDRDRNYRQSSRVSVMFPVTFLSKIFQRKHNFCMRT